MRVNGNVAKKWVGWWVSRINQTMEDAARDIVDVTVPFDVILMLGLFAIRVLPGHIGAWCILCPVE